MSTLNLLDGKLHVNIIVQIAGKKVDFVSLWLDQIYGDHHRFSVTLDYDILDKSFMSDPAKQFELLSSPVTFQIQHGSNANGAYVFNGVVTNVRNTGKEGKHGHIILEGASPTIMLEQGKRMEVYSNMTLSKVFEDVTSRVNPQYLAKSNKPLLQANVDFLMQYSESDWEFLRRIAYLYGENLFYSGKELVFGSFNEPDPTKLVYDKEIIAYEFCSRLIPNAFVNYHYLSEEDTIFEKDSPNNIGDDKYVKVALERGQDLTEVKSPKSPIEVPVADKSTLDEIVNRKKERAAAQTIVLIAEAKTYEACVGQLINVSLADGIGAGKNLGTYRVIKSKHVIDQNHRYKNYFEAVPASLNTVPVPEIELPLVNAIIATVRDNADPAGLGRIQVDFPFASNYSFAWLRVMSPDAGSSDKVSKSRGMMFIPEVGDQVIVGFEFNDPNRPFVMGSMFHGKNTGGGGQGNKTKSLSTRSGCAVTLDDEKGSAELKDPSGNRIFLDGAGGIDITAPLILKINVGSSTLEMKEDGTINITGAKEIKQDSGGNTITITSDGNKIETKSENATITKEEGIAISTKTGISITDSVGGVTIDAKTDVNLQAEGKISIQATGNVDVDGSQVQIN